MHTTDTSSGMPPPHMMSFSLARIANGESPVGWCTSASLRWGEKKRGGARETRGEAWAEILDCGDEGGSVPRMLQDAWDEKKRSREYLNASEHDCDAKYYAHAFVAS